MKPSRTGFDKTRQHKTQLIRCPENAGLLSLLEVFVWFPASEMMLLSQQALQVGTRVSPKWGSYRGDRTALMSKKSPDGRGGVAEMKASLDKKPARSLTAADVCDRCSARAAVETVMMQGGSLLWCAHHFAFFEDALNAFGATILVDERRR